MQLDAEPSREETPVVPPRPPTTNAEMPWDYVLQHGTFRLRDLEKFVCRLEKEGRVLNRVKQVINFTKRAEVSCLPAGTRKPLGRKRVIPPFLFCTERGCYFR